MPRHLIVRNSAVKIYKFPTSSELIHRNIVFDKQSAILGGFSNGYSYFTRLHVVIMTNLKIKATESRGSVQDLNTQPDSLKDGQY